MGGWLEKITAGASKSLNQLANPKKKTGMPAKLQVPSELPTATIIYGIASGLIFVDALYLLVRGRWFTGLVMMVIGGCLMGFALHYLKHQD